MTHFVADLFTGWICGGSIIGAIGVVFGIWIARFR